MQQHNEIKEFMQKRRWAKAILQRIDNLWDNMEIRPYRKVNPLRPTRQMVRNWKTARVWYKQHSALMTYLGWTPYHFFHAGTEPYTYRKWGPAWVFCWQQPGLKVKPERDGRIFFTWPRANGGYATVCWQPGKDSELSRRLRNSRGKPQSTGKRSPNVPSGYINITKLYERWPPDLIDEFAAIPDMTKPNPINPNWRPMKLYSLKRIEETEASLEFQQSLRSSIFVRQN